MKPFYIIIIAFIILFGLIYFGKIKKEGLTSDKSSIDETIDYTKIKNYLIDFKNNYTDDINSSINFSVDDPSQNLVVGTPYNLMESTHIGVYYANYAKFTNKDDIFYDPTKAQMSPNLSMTTNCNFVNTNSFKDLLGCLTEINNIIDKININIIKDTKQIQEYNMLIFSKEIINYLIIIYEKTFTLFVNTLDTTIGQDLIDKYGVIFKFLNTFNQKILMIFYYMIPYYTLNVFNIPDSSQYSDHLNILDPNKDIFNNTYVMNNLTDYSYYQPCLDLNVPTGQYFSHIQALPHKFQY